MNRPERHSLELKHDLKQWTARYQSVHFHDEHLSFLFSGMPGILWEACQRKTRWCPTSMKLSWSVFRLILLNLALQCCEPRLVWSQISVSVSQILEGMPMTIEVEKFLRAIGPFYELVEEKKKISQVSDLSAGLCLCCIRLCCRKAIEKLNLLWSASNPTLSPFDKVC